MSARYTYISGTSVPRVIDEVNEFCRKYPEYRLMQVLADHTVVIAFLTTDA
jgi:hypothetical protein